MKAKRSRRDRYMVAVAEMARRHKEERQRLDQSIEQMRRDLEPTIEQAKGQLSQKHQRDWYELRREHGFEMGPAATRILKGVSCTPPAK